MRIIKKLEEKKMLLRLRSLPTTPTKTTAVETRAEGDSRMKVAIVKLHQPKMASLLVKSRKSKRVIKTKRRKKRRSHRL